MRDWGLKGMVLMCDVRTDPNDWVMRKEDVEYAIRQVQKSKGSWYRPVYDEQPRCEEERPVWWEADITGRSMRVLRGRRGGSEMAETADLEMAKTGDWLIGLDTIEIDGK